jgi:hypothetical protein
MPIDPGAIDAARQPSEKLSEQDQPRNSRKCNYLQYHAPPAPAGRPQHESRLDQRRQLSRFRGDEQGNRIASIAPVIDRVFPFEEVPAAYRHFESRAHFGKVVVNHG